jgi:hypothetical protein
MARPRARTLLAAVVLPTLTAMLTATSGIAAGTTAGPAQFSQRAASAAERQMFGEELIGKVTRAGKVGRIDAKVGDLVVRDVQVPGGVGARSALGPATVQDATVLHGEHTRTMFSSPSRYYRIVVAVQENQSDQVRAYAKGHLFWDSGSLIATFRGIVKFCGSPVRA